MASARLRGKKYTGLYRDASGAQRSAGSFDTEAEALKAARHAEAVANLLERIEVHPAARRGEDHRRGLRLEVAGRAVAGTRGRARRRGAHRGGVHRVRRGPWRRLSTGVYPART